MVFRDFFTCGFFAEFLKREKYGRIGVMINYYSLPDSDLPMSMRFLRMELKLRGWEAEKLCREGGNNLILTRPDGKALKVASSIPPTTSVYALRLADDKLMSYALLQELGVSQPETVVMRGIEDAEKMLEKYGTIVIKPTDGAHGCGVTTGITTLEQAEKAMKIAIQASPVLKIAIIQPQLPEDGLETRVICIDYRFVMAMARIPARVTGDGRHNLKELIELENATIRTEAYRSNLAFIDMAMAEKYLGKRLFDMPGEGEKVRVVASCNVGQGGTMEDCSEKLTPAMRELAEKIARAAELPVVGIDFYGDQVIEINASPALYHPVEGEAATKAIKAYVDYLEKL